MSTHKTATIGVIICRSRMSSPVISATLAFLQTQVLPHLDIFFIGLHGIMFGSIYVHTQGMQSTNSTVLYVSVNVTNSPSQKGFTEILFSRPTLTCHLSPWQQLRSRCQDRHPPSRPYALAQLSALIFIPKSGGFWASLWPPWK